MKKYSRLRAVIDLDAVMYNMEMMHANIEKGTKMGCLSILWIDQGKYCLWKTGGIDGRNYRCGEEGKYP